MIHSPALFAPARRNLLCAFAGLALLLPGCVQPGLNTGGATTSFGLTVRSNADNTKNHLSSSAPFSVSASCQSGEQMVGGGYQLINNSNANPTSVVVEGTYPSAPSTWTVQVRNPDNPPIYSGDADVVVHSLVYCVTTPNFDLGTEIVLQRATLPHTTDSTDIDVRCSQTSALALSGGFLTTSLPPFTDAGGAGYEAFWPGLIGTGIMTSGPRLPDNTHSSMGWHVTQLYTPVSFPTAPRPDVTTTVFAICARRGINDQAHRVAKASNALTPGRATERAVPYLDVLCQEGEFTVGGGYDRFSLTWNTGHSGVAEVDQGYVIHSPFNFDGWRISGESQYNTVDALALCVRIPIIQR